MCIHWTIVFEVKSCDIGNIYYLSGNNRNFKTVCTCAFKRFRAEDKISRKKSPLETLLPEWFCRAFPATYALNPNKNQRGTTAKVIAIVEA